MILMTFSLVRLTSPYTTGGGENGFRFVSALTQRTTTVVDDSAAVNSVDKSAAGNKNGEGELFDGDYPQG
jgi:hypothetical protein